MVWGCKKLFKNVLILATLCMMLIFLHFMGYSFYTTNQSTTAIHTVSASIRTYTNISSSLTYSETIVDNFSEIKQKVDGRTQGNNVVGNPGVLYGSFLSKGNENVTKCTASNKPEFLKEPQKWEKVQDRAVYTFSAFYEDRPQAGGPAIRIIAMGLQERFIHIGDLYCKLWYTEFKDAFIVHGQYENIYPSLGHKDMTVSHFIICPLPNAIPTIIPYAATVEPTRCANSSSHLLVLGGNKNTTKSGHALCSPALYGSKVEPEIMIEMLELYRLIGIEHVTVYDYQVRNKVLRNVLDIYSSGSSPFLEVIDWKYPENLRQSYFVQRAHLNDCVYRNRIKYRYVTVCDIDEIQMPRQHDTLPKFMASFSHSNVGAFLFQHYYFVKARRTQLVKEQLTSISQTSFNRTDTPIPPGKIRCKAMYDADQVLKIDIHFPYKLIKGSKEMILDPEKGALHHYRNSPMETFRKDPDQFIFVEDRYAEKYKSPLLKAIKEKYNQLSVLNPV